MKNKTGFWLPKKVLRGFLDRSLQREKYSCAEGISKLDHPGVGYKLMSLPQQSSWKKFMAFVVH
jgi:hypothetical protein